MISLRRGDIAAMDVDAIVNAANRALAGGGGVDGAIHRAAGPGLLAECLKLGGCPTGEARATGGHGLKARHIIHTVGPVWDGGDKGEPELLAACHRSSLRLAASLGARTVAFPAISCGAYGFPIPLAAQIAVRTVREETSKLPLREVLFVLFDEAAERAWRKALEAPAAP